MSENNLNSENRNLDHTRVDGGNDFNFETEVVTNESGKKAIKVSKLTKKQKELLLSSGVGFAGLAAGAGAFTMLSFNDAPDAGENAEVTVSGEETVVLELDTPVAASGAGSMSFNQAFAAAREELGPGGLFVFEGDVYHTYTASEWNNMSPADQTDFSSSITVQNPDVAPTTTVETPAEVTTTTAEEVPTTNTEDAGADMEIIGYDLDNDGNADMYVFDLDENGIPDVLIDSTGEGVYNEVIMNVDFESDAPVESYESFDVEIYPEDLQGVEVISTDRGDEAANAEAANVTAQDDLIFDELAGNDMDINFDNESDVSDFI
jgi:hypothetical protein